MKKSKTCSGLRKKINCVLGLSIMSAVLSVTAVVRCEPMEFDAVALLASIISIPVAVLAIFLAINYLVFENKMKEYVKSTVSDLERRVNSETGTIKAELESQVKDITHAVKSYFIYANSGSFIVSSMHSRLIGCLEGLKEEEASKQKYALDAIMEEFVALIPRLREDERYLPIGTKQEYLNVIRHIDHPDINTILNFVCGLNEECTTNDGQEEQEEQEESEPDSNATQLG